MLTTGKEKSAILRTRIAALVTAMDIGAMYAGLRTLHDVACGLAAEPRFWNGEQKDATPAGEALEVLSELIAGHIDDLAETMKSMKPSSSAEKTLRNELLIGHAVHVGADAIEIAALASSLAAAKH